MTALRCASQAGHTDVIRLLLSAGANVDQTTEVRDFTFLFSFPCSLVHFPLF